MPGLSGDEVARRIHERGDDCAVVMVTAVEPDFDIVELGFDDYITKPIEGDQLRDAVRRVQSRGDYDAMVREHLGLLATKSALEAEKSEPELLNNQEYIQLKEQIAASRSKLGDSVTGDVVVDLLQREFGSDLTLVLSYTLTSWRYRYVSPELREAIGTLDADVNHVLDQFRQEGDRRADLGANLEWGGHTGSIHLFDAQLLVNFPTADGGLLCGFRPDAVPTLPEFVSIVEPYVS